jgi:hypothetical protein
VSATLFQAASAASSGVFTSSALTSTGASTLACLTFPAGFAGLLSSLTTAASHLFHLHCQLEQHLLLFQLVVF